MKKGNNLEFLKRWILFAEMDRSELEQVNNLLESESFNSGDTLFLEGEVGDKAFFLKKGRVKVIKSTPTGDEQILDIFQPGELFGEVVLFGIGEYPATAVAMEQLQVEALSREKFREYFNQHPKIAWGMLSIMARKLYRAQSKIRDLGQRDAKGRVATLLLDLLNNSGDFQTEQAILDINRQEMADYIGTTRETVSRTLSEFRSLKLVEMKDNRIYIKDLAGLKQWIE